MAIIFYQVYKITKILPSEMMVKEVYLATKSNKNNSFVTLDELPLRTVNAFLAAENSNYLENGSP